MRNDQVEIMHKFDIDYFELRSKLNFSYTIAVHAFRGGIYPYHPPPVCMYVPHPITEGNNAKIREKYVGFISPYLKMFQFFISVLNLILQIHGGDVSSQITFNMYVADQGFFPHLHYDVENILECGRLF